jgi:4-amino-4-deoxy-L-arabinose transferase-like glycosyltransferase
MDIKKYSLAILFTILILAVTLRMWGITSESYWLDESISIKQAQEDYATSIEMVKEEVNFPLYTTLLHFWMKPFGISEFSSRFLSLIFGVLSVMIIYLLAKRLFSERAAVISALFMCFSPIMIYYSQEARSYSLFVLLTLLSFYFFVSYLEKKDHANLIAYVFFSLLLIYTHLFTFLVLLIQNMHILYLFYQNKFKSRILLNWFIGQFVLLLLFIPWLLNLFKQVTNSALSIIWIPKPDMGAVVFTAYDFFGNYLVLLIFIILIEAFIMIKRFRPKTIDEKNELILLSLWILLPFLLVLAYSLPFSSLYTTRYLLFTLPAFFLLFAVIIDRLGRLVPKKKFIPWIVVCVVIISSLVSVGEQVSRKDKDDWRAVSDYIRQNVDEGDIVFIDPFYQQQPFSYYYDIDCFKEYDIYSCNFNKHRILSLDWKAECCIDASKVTATDEKNELKNYLKDSIWLISAKPELYTHDVNSSLFSYFDNRKNMTVSKNIDEIWIYKFE